jgi:hypothetical protein
MRRVRPKCAMMRPKCAMMRPEGAMMRPDGTEKGRMEGGPSESRRIRPKCAMMRPKCAMMRRNAPHSPEMRDDAPECAPINSIRRLSREGFDLRFEQGVLQLAEAESSRRIVLASSWAAWSRRVSVSWAILGVKIHRFGACQKTRLGHGARGLFRPNESRRGYSSIAPSRLVVTSLSRSLAKMQ